MVGGGGQMHMGAGSLGGIPSGTWSGPVADGGGAGAGLMPPLGGGANPSGAADPGLPEDAGPPLPAGIEVRVTTGPHVSRTGRISQVRGGGASYAVALVGDGGAQVVDFKRNELDVVTPVKKDQIIIIHGDLINSTGILIGVDGTDGIVKMSTTGDIKIVELRSCAKLV
jgi:hypothetical protein